MIVEKSEIYDGRRPYSSSGETRFSLTTNSEGQALLFDIRFNILSRFSVAGCVVESNHVLSVNRRLPQCGGNLPERIFFGIRYPLAAESKEEPMGPGLAITHYRNARRDPGNYPRI